jgi:hypothetical protein
MVEIDYPRGGGGDESASTHRLTRQSTSGATADETKRKSKGVKRRLPEWLTGGTTTTSHSRSGKSKAPPSKKTRPQRAVDGELEGAGDEYKEAFRRAPTRDLLSEGVRGLGFVKEV